jgi:hypothetical protein
MKRLMILVGLLMLAGTVKAMEHPGNPDRFPSIGLSLDGASQSGTLTTKATGASFSQDGDATDGALTLDTRLPISDNTTLYGAVGLISSKSSADETNILTGGETKSSGVAVHLGARWYIH